MKKINKKKTKIIKRLIKINKAKLKKKKKIFKAQSIKIKKFSPKSIVNLKYNQKPYHKKIPHPKVNLEKNPKTNLKTRKLKPNLTQILMTNHQKIPNLHKYLIKLLFSLILF
jgi:hypothetical protein